MIRYTIEGRVRFHQNREMQQPFWQATTVHLYSPDVRSVPLGIDFVRLKASAHRSIEVAVPRTLEGLDLDRLPSPVLIDAWGPEELIYRRGDALLHELSSDARPMLLLSSDGDVPREMSAVLPLLIVTAWPLDLVALESIAERASEAGLEWGILIPVIFPITTNLDAIETISRTARQHGASFMASSSIELDPKARGAVASMCDDLDEETWATLFDADLDRIHLATERHIASLAHELGIADTIAPPLGESRSNRAAAIFLSRIGARMVRMDHDVELGWKFLKASGRIATLDKEIARIASTAHVTILPELEEEMISEVVEQWLESGSAEFADHIDDKWRVKRR